MRQRAYVLKCTLFATAALTLCVIAGSPGQIAAGPPARSVQFCKQTLAPTETSLRCYEGRTFSPTSASPMDLRPLAKLTQLRELSLVSGELEFIATLPLEDLTPLAGLTHLTSLSLGHTTVTDIRPLAGLKQLESLRLHAAPIQDFSPLAGLTNLEDLSLNSTCAKDVKMLQKLVKLRSLDLSGTAVSDLTPLRGLENLEVLLLSRGSVNLAQRKSLQRHLPGLKIVEGRSCGVHCP